MTLIERIYEKRWDDPVRMSKIWEVLVDSFFQPMIPADSAVLDIGCGFCYFLNHLRAREKIGVDANPDAARHAAADVVVNRTDDLSLPMLPDGYFDRVFISNFLEHLDGPSEVIALLTRVRELLKPGGKVLILQPNFRLLGPAYFDFIDHKTVLTEKSVREALTIAGLVLEREIVRFLPYTAKSRLPQHPMLVRAYLWIRPLWLIFGRQSLFVAVKPGC